MIKKPLIGKVNIVTNTARHNVFMSMMGKLSMTFMSDISILPFIMIFNENPYAMQVAYRDSIIIVKQTGEKENVRFYLVNHCFKYTTTQQDLSRCKQHVVTNLLG